MKKLITLTIFALALALGSCSSDNDGGASLQVNEKTFHIGSNTAQREYNVLVYEDAHRKVLKLIEKTNAGTDPKVIELDFNFNGSTVDGSYPVYSTAFQGNWPDHYVIGDYNTPALYFGNADASGTIDIIDLGSQKYKLTFTNAQFSADDGSGQTRTINGSCTAKFW